MQIGNITQFETEYNNIVVDNESALTFLAKNPGTWGNSIEIAIAKPALFVAEFDTYAFEDIKLNDLFEYFPDDSNDEIAVIVKANDSIVETYIVSMYETAKDFNNKSIFIETVINQKSEYLFVKASGTEVASAVYSADVGSTGMAYSPVIELEDGLDEDASEGTAIDAYMLWDNKEDIDIDIIIGNERYPSAAVNLVNARKDCIAFIGASTDDVVGVNSVTAVANLIDWRNNDLQDNMFVCAAANAIYIYDKFADKNRWINIAGSIAGLRAAVNTNRASWFASAGLERGKILNVLKLAFNPDVAKRDMLYKSGLNPIVSFPGTGAVMWGQKTLQSKASSFDRINVRGLFFLKQYK